MCWIKDELYKIDNNITNDKQDIIISIVYEDMIRNGKCSVNDYKEAICGDGCSDKCIPLQKKASKILEITYKMVSGL